MSGLVTKSGGAIAQLAESAGGALRSESPLAEDSAASITRREFGSIRRYSADDLKRVRSIKRAQAVGFLLDEVGLLLGLSDGRHCAETKALVERKFLSGH